MSQGKSGNIIPKTVSDILTPGFKRSRRLAEKKETVRSSSLPNNTDILSSSSPIVTT